MDQTSKNTLLFCIDFTRTHFREASQTTQCKTWLKTAIEILKNTDSGSADFIMSELTAVDKWLAGGDSSSTSEDILSRIQTAETLAKDL